MMNDPSQPKLTPSPAERFQALTSAGQEVELESFLAGCGAITAAELAAVLRVDQRRRWNAGEPLRAEAYLAQFPLLAEDSEAAIDVIYAEYLLRQRLGDAPQPGEYTQRFPHYAEQLAAQVELNRLLEEAPLKSSRPGPDTETLANAWPAGRLQQLWDNGERPDLRTFLACTGPLPPEQLFAVLRVDQRQRWRYGERPLVEGYFQAFPAARSDRDAALGLICTECLLREERGEAVKLDEYQARLIDFADVLQHEFNVHWASLKGGSARGTSSALAVANSPSAQARPANLRTAGEKPLICPHCQSPIEVAADPQSEVVCPSCGSSIVVELGSTRTHLPAHAPRRLGKYELLQQVGVGAFGTVCKARDTELDRIVAIKVPRSGNLTSREDVDRFLREARSAAHLRHPGIVSVIDAGQFAGTCYIVSEFVQGATLSDHLSAGRFRFRESASLVADIADAVHYAHEHGVIHRDIKPSNIMLESIERPMSKTIGRPSGSSSSNVDLEAPRRTGPSTMSPRPKLMDFGLARREVGEITMTLDGQVLGTPAYMPPEQARGEAHKVDARGDVYSLGVVLYELLTGELPFRGNSRMLIVQVIQDEPRAPRRINDKIPRDLETICLKAMLKDPGRRYPTARDLADDLRRFLNGEPIKARTVGPVERLARWCRRNPRTALLAGSVVTLLLVLALGSSAAALWLKRERDDAQAAKELAIASERNRRQEGYRADLSELRASRLAGRAGERESGLTAIRNILAALPREELDEEKRAELRDEALACLVLADVRETMRRQMPSSDFLDADVNPSFELAAWRDGERGSTAIAKLRTPAARLDRLTGPESMLRMFRRFSPDGHWLAELLIPGTDGLNHLRLWDCQAQRVVFDEPKVWAGDWPTFHPNAPYLLLPGIDASLHIVELPSGREVHRSPTRFPHARPAFSPDGKWVALASLDFSAQIVDTETWETVAALPELGQTTAAAWNPVATWQVVLGDTAGGLHVWDVKQNTRHPLRPHNGSVESLQFSPNGAFLASSSADNIFTVRLINGEQPFVTLPGRVLRFSDDSRRIAFANAGELMVGELVGGEAHVSSRVPHAEGVTFSPDGHWLAVSGLLGVHLLSARDCSFAASLELDPCGPAIFQPRGQELVTYGLFSHVRRWPLTRPAPGSSEWTIGPAGRAIPLGGGSLLQQFTIQPRHFARYAAWSEDGTRLVLADSREGRVLLVDAANTEQTPRLLAEMPGVGHVAISPNGQWVAAAARNASMLRVWNVADGRDLLSAPEPATVAFSPDGHWFAAVSRQRVDLYTTQNWQRLRSFEREESDDWLSSPLAFQPHGRLIAFGVSRREARLCDCQTGRVVANLRLHESQNLTGVSFSPDGTRLAYTSGGFVVGVWNLAELRAGLVDLGLDPDGLPNRAAPPPNSPTTLRVVRGSKIPSPDRWTENWLALAAYEASPLGSGLPDAIDAATQALRLIRQGDLPQERAEIHVARARILNTRAGYHLRNHDLRAARDDWEHSLSLAPGEPEPTRRLARLDLLGPLELRNPDRAMTLLAGLAEREDQSEEQQLLLGIAHVFLNRVPKGMSILDSLATSNPQPLVDYVRAMGLHKLGARSEAAEMFATANASHENSRPALDRLESEELDRLREETERALSSK